MALPIRSTVIDENIMHSLLRMIYLLFMENVVSIGFQFIFKKSKQYCILNFGNENHVFVECKVKDL